MHTGISAVQHLRPLRGGAQSHLLNASDGACYVTKFQNNPQHIRVLANEMLATRLGLTLGLPMPQVEVIEVSDWLIEHTEDLRIQLGGQRIPCRSGKQLGSLYVGSPGMTLDYLPQELLRRASNVAVKRPAAEPPTTATFCPFVPRASMETRSEFCCSRFMLVCWNRLVLENFASRGRGLS